MVRLGTYTSYYTSTSGIYLGGLSLFLQEEGKISHTMIDTVIHRYEYCNVYTAIIVERGRNVFHMKFFSPPFGNGLKTPNPKILIMHTSCLLIMIRFRFFFCLLATGYRNTSDHDMLGAGWWNVRCPAAEGVCREILGRTARLCRYDDEPQRSRIRKV